MALSTISMIPSVFSALLYRLPCIVILSAQEPKDVNEGCDCCGHHEDARFGPQFAAIEPGRSGKGNLKEMSDRGLSAIISAYEEELPEIKSRVPADRPPERSGAAHAQANR